MTFERVEIGPATLYLGDCREILPTLDNVDLVLTDPPYGIGAAKKKAHSSIRDNDGWEFQEWDNATPAKEVFDSMIEISLGAIIWGGNYFAHMLPPSGGWLCWRKPEAETGFSLADIELCWTSFPFASRTLSLPRRDGNAHPTQKPVALIRWAIGFAPKSTQTILDPFMGSGTTGVACVEMGKTFIGIEREPKYFEIACKRIAHAVEWSKQRLFEPEPEPEPLTPSLGMDSAGWSCPKREPHATNRNYSHDRRVRSLDLPQGKRLPLHM